MKDLFGCEIIEDIKLPRCKRGINYRLSNDDRKCKYCIYKIKNSFHNKIYYKCEIIGITHGIATDIRLKDVCDNYKSI
jgi:hypothetical protein